MSHITGGGIAANLARVLPQGVALEVERSAWQPNDVFSVLAGWGGFALEAVEGTWNLGLGQALVVSAESADAVAAAIDGFQLGVVTAQPTDLEGWVQGAKGTDGGAVRLVGRYRA